jgi:hypothetical protein
MLQNMIKKGKSDISNSADLFGSKNKKKTEQNTQLKDTATYIPSSAFVAQAQPLSKETINAYNNLMDTSDKI